MSCKSDRKAMMEEIMICIKANNLPVNADLLFTLAFCTISELKQICHGLHITTTGDAMTDTTKFEHGMRVRYVPMHADGDITHADCEDGTVSSTNDHVVFVKFDKQVSKLGWEATSQACNPSDLMKLADLILEDLQ